MTQFIIHVGPPKTGSSYLQAALLAARPQLAGRGILYPPFWGETSHHELAERLAAGPEGGLERQFGELRRSGYPTVVISAGGLANLAPAAIEHLRMLTRPRHDVRIVFYVRRWTALLPAYWQQAVQAGETQTLREFLLAWAGNPADCPFVNFAPALRQFVQQFGDAALQMVAYDQVMAEGGDLFRHFCMRFLDWTDPPAPVAQRVNVSPGAAEIEVVRAVHGIERAWLGRRPAPDDAKALSAWLLGNAAGCIPAGLRQALTAHLTSAQLDENDLHLAQLQRELFNEFQHMLVEPRPKAVLFEAQRAEIPYILRDYMLAPGVVGELHAIHRRALAARPVAAPSPDGGRQELR